MGKLSKAEKKLAYDAKLCQLLDDYSQVLIVAADNVGSNQLQNIRKGLRGDSVVLMGKNTMMKRSIRIHSEKTGNEAYLNLIPLLQVCFFLKIILVYLDLIWCDLNWVFFWEVCLLICIVICVCFGVRVMWVWYSPRVIWRKSVKRLPSTRYLRFCIWNNIGYPLDLFKLIGVKYMRPEFFLFGNLLFGLSFIFMYV